MLSYIISENHAKHNCARAALYNVKLITTKTSGKDLHSTAEYIHAHVNVPTAIKPITLPTEKASLIN